MRVSGATRPWVLGCLLMLAATPLRGQDLDPAVVVVGLDSALALATDAAIAAFPELPQYLLYSITPRVLKADPGGLHWQVRWQERAFPHHRWLIVRVYMRDARVHTERVDEPRVPTGRGD